MNFKKGFSVCFSRTNEYFGTETVKLPKKSSVEVFNIYTRLFRTVYKNVAK